jgi:hypothetical protein
VVTEMVYSVVTEMVYSVVTEMVYSVVSENKDLNFWKEATVVFFSFG